MLLRMACQWASDGNGSVIEPPFWHRASIRAKSSDLTLPGTCDTVATSTGLMIAIGVLLAALSVPAATTVSIQRAGEVVSRGEICRFAAGDAENPFKRWLSSQDVICVPAGTPIEFPRGRWNVFARADKAISSTPVLVDGREAPVDLALTLHDAATIVPALPAGRTAVAYAPRRGIAVPVANGGEGVLVPANEELWLIVLEKSKPVALFPIAALEARSVRAIDAPSAGPPALLGWLQVS